MRYLLPLLLLCAGCSCFPIQKHLVIEGDGIITPYGRGDKIKITRDVTFGRANEKNTPAVAIQDVDKKNN